MTKTGEHLIIPEFDLSKTSGGAEFMDNGVSLISGFKVSESGSSPAFARDIKLIPNPTKGAFTISGIDADAEVDIYDLHGQLILSTRNFYAPGKEIDLSGQETGIYVVRIFNKGEYVYKKLILN